MKTSEDLRELLNRIDHKGYPAYKDTKGAYTFDGYLMSIDHVQGDPFAAPSKVSVKVSGKEAAFPKELYDMPCKRIALQDQLLRAFAKIVRDYSFKAKGSGKSGLLSVTVPGQEVLERSGCQLDAETGGIILKMEVGFPANGRTINSRELIKIFFDFLPKCVKDTLTYNSWKKRNIKIISKDGASKVITGDVKLDRTAKLSEDQQYIRDKLKEKGLVAFVADGAVLPRESGVSSRPMKGAIRFASPESMKVSFDLPNKGNITGMGIPEGITLIVGGGYHGKSTLLKALELGVYNHISGDGREYVITEPSAMKLRAEDGRSIKEVDISLFIKDLPNGKDTAEFSTEDASGSTSQAANVMEAASMGSKVFLIDEDTSATNFMIRDELMQQVVVKDMEPITPYIDRITSLYRQWGISTILVAGSSGSYFTKADNVIQMNRYVPYEITKEAREKAAAFYGQSVDKMGSKGEAAAEELPEVRSSRVIKADAAFAKNPKNKLKTMGRDSISINRDVIDLRYVEQLVDSEQLNALGQLLKYAKLHVFDGRRTLIEAVDMLEKCILEKGFDGICDGMVPGNLALPRRQEIAAAFYRYREL